MREVTLSRPGLTVDAETFLACLATVLELPPERVPEVRMDGDPSSDWTLAGWLGSLGIGLVKVADPDRFAWAGPWIARLRDPGGERRCVVMYGKTPSGVVWDPVGDGEIGAAVIEDGFVLAAEDIALALPPAPARTLDAGAVEQIWISPSAGDPVRPLQVARLIAGAGIHGDRYVEDRGTFPAARPGGALTLIEAEVCESFDPPLAGEEHRRNLVTRGVRLEGLLGSEFRIGALRCRGVRPCEPCATMQRYAERPLLRALVHRGGIRADILDSGEIRVGDTISARQ